MFQALWVRHSLITYGRFAIPFTNRKACFEILILNLSAGRKISGPGPLLAHGLHTLFYGIG